MKPHELAQLFPEADNFEDIVADVKKTGVLESIWVYEGKILDGWHRYQAAQVAGVEPEMREYEGDDPVGFVTSMNIHRRHLNKGQRALLLVKIADQQDLLMKQGDPTTQRLAETASRSADDIADAVGVGKRTVYQAMRVMDEAPEKVDDILAGKESLDAVDDLLRQARAQERVKEKTEKKEKKAKEERHRSVALFLDHIQVFAQVIWDINKDIDKFSPEGAAFTIKKLEKIIEAANDLVSTLEEVSNG